MKTLILGLAFTLVTAASQAQRAPDPSPPPQQVSVQPATVATSSTQLDTRPDEAILLSHRHYKASNGQDVHAPAKSMQDVVPAGASAKCRDGSYSFSQNRRGTCAHHGGVGAWL